MEHACSKPRIIRCGRQIEILLDPTLGKLQRDSRWKRPLQWPTGHCSPRTLSQWPRRVGSWKRQGCDVSVYFDNDQKSAAPVDARRLSEMTGRARRRTNRNQPLDRPFDTHGHCRLIGFLGWILSSIGVANRFGWTLRLPQTRHGSRAARSAML
ncbi:DUF72 domain-containing protein [Bradyrhizobium sp. AZCC 1721]|uniref:DUF72 domain-containing protein n=1 Tax=Bradyrhizobium sp. AZCC 1721 TaxID=3117016 RepID=UPI003FA578DB